MQGGTSLQVPKGHTGKARSIISNIKRQPLRGEMIEFES